MKRILVNILALVVVIAVALPMMDGTLATWSDSETSADNYIETGSLDLLVARCDTDWQDTGTFADDPPWGVGLDPCFNIPDIEPDETYPCYLLLWNAGCVDGRAYLHVKDVPEGNPLAAGTTMQIWYDDDADPDTPPELITSDNLADLNCREIELGPLENEQQRQLLLELVTGSTTASGSLNFTIAFELAQLEPAGLTCAWADSEYSPNTINAQLDLGGSPGFWSGPGASKCYDKADMVSWFKAIVYSSAWYEDSLAAGTDEEVYDRMCAILKSHNSKHYERKVDQFRTQYLTTLLNTMPDPPRLQPGTTHDISSVPGAEACFGCGSGTLSELITAIEGKADSDMLNEPPSQDELEAMKNVCEKLNNP